MQHKAPFIVQASPLIDRYIKIVKPPRRLESQVGIVRDVFWKGDELWVVVQLTSGRQVAVAYGWTDLPVEGHPPKRDTPEIGPSVLLEMAQYWQRRKASKRPKTTS